MDTDKQPAATEVADVDPKIVEAIKTIRSKVRRLTHDSTNLHQKYNYVSIDTYYEHVVPACVEVGLVWRARETDWKLERSGEKALVILTLAFDLFVGDVAARDYMRITVPGPLVGPQTTGQLYSYADKVFMRVAFGIATGEADGDAMKPDDNTRRLPTGVPSSPKGNEDFAKGDVPVGHDPITGEVYEAAKPVAETPQSAEAPAKVATEDELKAGSSHEGDPIIDTRKINKASAELVAKIFETWMPKVTNRSRLLDWHAENVAAIETVGKVDPVIKERIKGMFNERNAMLKAKETK